MKIAMWSGPRNLSTAMMYSFGARSDCAVWDEPFYAAYLSMSGLDHPMRREILSTHECDPVRVVGRIKDTIPGENAHFYQKHMTQHMLAGIDRRWMADVTNVFLIRHPARVVASYAAKREKPTLQDIGFQQQADLFDYATSLGQTPPVVDSADIRDDPEGALRQLCARIGISFDAQMLSWPKGGHADDGVWAAHWYPAVHNSTGFAGPEGALPKLSGENEKTAELALPFYEKLKRCC